jgi:hypothetical protein
MYLDMQEARMYRTCKQLWELPLRCYNVSKLLKSKLQPVHAKHADLSLQLPTPNYIF